MARFGGRHTRFDSMDFPDYEYQEYPRAVQIPRVLPKKMPDCADLDEGSRNFDGNGNLIAEVVDGKWKPWPIEVVVKNETEAKEIMERHNTGKPLTADAEKVQVLAMCKQLGVQHDKRWSIDRLKKAMHEHQAMETNAA